MGTEAWVVGGDDITVLQEGLKSWNRARAPPASSDGAHVLVIPVVGCAHAITARPPAGIGPPSGANTTALTAIGLPVSKAVEV